MFPKYMANSDNRINGYHTLASKCLLASDYLPWGFFMTEFNQAIVSLLSACLLATLWTIAIHHS